LQIVGALLKADAVLSTAELAGQLTSENGRLAALRYDDGSGQGAPSVMAAFELSYCRLDETAARVFRLLAASPGPDISTDSTAELAGLPVPDVRRVLAGLATAHLVEVAPGKPGRWRMHDLVRLYAIQLSEEHAEADGREEARDRLLGHYLHMADAADDHLRALPGMPVPTVFADREAAMDWLDGERASLVATIRMAADTGRDEPALRLPLLLVEYLDWRRRFGDMQVTAAISLDAARRLGDRHHEAIALQHLGDALRKAGRLEEAITAHQQELEICRETGDRHGEGRTLDNLGGALREAGRLDEAITAYQDAAALFRETGDRHREGRARASLGAALRETRQFEESITAYQEAAAIFRETGDQDSERIVLDTLKATTIAQAY
jgi:tetratricopeptide (TPR) repeat protein